MALTRISSLNSYSLQESETASGTVKVTLYSDLAGLTLPAGETVALTEDLTESIDGLPGEIQIEEWEIQVEEDYSTYTEGFWFKVLNSEAVFMVTLDAGAGDEHFFVGRPTGESVLWEDHYLNGTVVRRSGSLALRSFIAELEDIDVADVMTEINTQKTTGVEATIWTGATTSTESNCWFITIRKYLACFVKVAYGQTFAETDVSFDMTNGGDLRFTISDGVGTQQIDTCSFFLGYNDGTDHNAEFYNSAADEYVANRFASAWDFMRAICRNFAIVPRYYYDTSASRHKIEFISRGRHSGAAMTIEQKILESTVQREDYATLRNITANYIRPYTSAHVNFDHYWILGGKYKFAVESGLYEGAEPFDMAIDSCLFNCNTDTTGQYILDCSRIWYVYNPGSGNEAHDASEWTFYDYDAATPGWSAGYTSGLEALVRYYYRRLRGAKLIFERKYGVMMATVTGATRVRYLHCLRLMQITYQLGGSQTTDFYVVGISRNLYNKETTLRLKEV